MSRSCVWDNENLVLPSDSGTLVWWSVSGDKLFEEKVASSDFIVHLEWSVSGKALWMCGFSTLSYVEVKKNHDGTYMSIWMHTHDNAIHNDGTYVICR